MNGRRHIPSRHMMPPTGAPHPVYDDQAWYAFPGQRWVYDKLSLAEHEGILCGPHGTYPDKYPVISRPIINLVGLSTGAILIHNDKELDDLTRPGSFWAEVLEGEHRSTDVMLSHGRQIWSCTSLGVPAQGFTFKHWEVGVEPGPENEAITTWLDGWLPKHTGVVNLETIGERIIEVHLRPAGQFMDLYGPRFIECANSLFDDVRVEPPAAPLKGWSVPLWTSVDAKVTEWGSTGIEGAMLFQRIEPGENASDYLSVTGHYMLGYVNSHSYDMAVRGAAMAIKTMDLRPIT